MEVMRTLRPGDPGTKRLYAHWGDKLIAVRYRRNTQTKKIITTIEIVIDEREQPPTGVSMISALAYRRQQVVAVPIAWEEHELRKNVKQIGARWSKQQKVWLMKHQNAVTLGLQDRIIEGLAEKCTDVDISFEL